MKIGITGYQGRLGSYLVKLGCEPLECDVTKTPEVMDALDKVKPDVVINCAAYTFVDKAENYDTYNREVLPVNTYAVFNLYNAMVSTLPVCHLIQMSTDYVFAGKDGPYTEKSEMLCDGDPVNAYGFTKFAAELLLEGCEHTTIVRTTGLFGNGDDFVTYLVSRALWHFDDFADVFYATKELIGNQTYIPFLVKDLLQLSEMIDKPHILHLASKDLMSRYEFALSVASVFELDKKRIVPVTNKQVPGWIAPRPTKGGLRTGLSKKLGFKQYTILDGLKALQER